MIIMKNKYELRDGYAEVFTKNNSFLVDTSDLAKVRDSLSTWNTVYNPSGDAYYAATHIKGKTVYLHRYLMGVTERNEQVDHINGNTLDNRRSNLRIVMPQQNNHNRHKLDSRNTSGYRGVFWSTREGKWLAKIQVGGKQIHCGHFSDVHEAGKAVKEARRLYMSHSQEAESADKFSDYQIGVNAHVQRSKSKIRGVTWDKERNKWQVRIKGKHLGRFETVEEAKRFLENYKKGAEDH